MKTLGRVLVSSLIFSGAIGQSEPDFVPEGVCSYSTDEVTCWDMAGKPSQTLTNRVSEAVRSTKDFSLRARYRKKARLLVVHRTGLALPEFQVSEPGAVMGIRGTVLPGLNSELVQVATEPEQSALTLFGSVAESKASEVARMPLKVGSEATLGKCRLRVREIGTAQEGGWWFFAGYFPNPAKTIWFIAVDTYGPSTAEKRIMSALLGRQGNVLTATDASQDVATKPTLSAIVSGPTGVVTLPTQDGTLLLLSEVDPARASALYLTSFQASRVTVGRFPMAPSADQGSSR